MVSAAIADEQSRWTPRGATHDVQARVAAREPTARRPRGAPTGTASPEDIRCGAATTDIDWPAVEAAVSGTSTPLGIVVTSFQGC